MGEEGFFGKAIRIGPGQANKVQIGQPQTFARTLPGEIRFLNRLPTAEFAKNVLVAFQLISASARTTCANYIAFLIIGE